MSIIGSPILLLASGTLCVTSMKNATVVFRRDGVTYKTVTAYTADSDGWHGKYYCRVPFGTWVIESTWDGETKSKTVIVNSTGQTNVKIIHTIIIFKEGTGLKNGFSVASAGNGGTYNVNATRIYQYSGESGWSGFTIKPAIPFIGDFTKVQFIHRTGNSAYGGGTLTVGISTSATGTGFNKSFGAGGGGNKVTSNLDISGYTSGTYYIKTFRNNGPQEENFYDIRLIP